MRLTRRIDRLEQRMNHQEPDGTPSIDEAWRAADTVQQKARVARRQIDESARQWDEEQGYGDITAGRRRELYEKRIR